MLLANEMKKINVEKNEEKKDLIKLLLEKDMTQISFDILSRLDSKSFTNCRLVSHQWKEFIDYQFHETPKGKKWMLNRLTSNFLNEKFTPREDKLNFHDKVCALVADGLNIYIITRKKLKQTYYFIIHKYVPLL